VILDVKRGRKVIARIAATAKPGRKRLTWNGRVGKTVKPKPGTYRIELRAVGGDGQSASDAAPLRLRR
jgi:hypothetical protein